MSTVAEIYNLVTAHTAPGKTRVVRMEIGPKEAEAMLENNTPNNRKLRESVVTKYANDMLAGQWQPESESMIVIGSDGQVYNGQHRLAAIMKSGVTVVMWVMTGADPALYEVMDNGCIRVTKDYLTVPNNGQVSMLSGIFHAMMNGNGPLPTCFQGRVTRNVSASRTDRLTTARENDETFQHYIADAKLMAKQTANKYISHIAIAIMVIDQFHQNEVLDDFINDFQNICNNNPIITICKERLLTNRTRSDRVEQRTYNIATLLTAYDLYRSGAHDKSETALRRAFNAYTKTLNKYEQLLENNRTTRWAPVRREIIQTTATDVPAKDKNNPKAQTKPKTKRGRKPKTAVAAEPVLATA